MFPLNATVKRKNTYFSHNPIQDPITVAKGLKDIDWRSACVYFFSIYFFYNFHNSQSAQNLRHILINKQCPIASRLKSWIKRQ